jgi:hypothetical protein
MIRLRDLLTESAENRINMMKVHIIMEKIYPELSSTQSEKLMKLCVEVNNMVDNLNKLRYIRTGSSLFEWKILIFAAGAKLTELRTEVEKISESTKEINFTPLLKALDEVLLT